MLARFLMVVSFPMALLFARQPHDAWRRENVTMALAARHGLANRVSQRLGQNGGMEFGDGSSRRRLQRRVDRERKGRRSPCGAGSLSVRPYHVRDSESILPRS